MAILNRRSRMVSFRLSEREYESLMTLCSDQGVRSLSDLARGAMHGLLKSPNGNENGSGLEAELRRLNGRVEELEEQVRRLANSVVVQR